MEDIRELIEFAQKEWPDLFQGKGVNWPDSQPHLGRAESPVNRPTPKIKSVLDAPPKIKTVFDLDKEP